jgi:multiple sugar transport system ATP-binding protein
MVFQNYALFPHLSVAENIVFGLRVRRVGAAERERRLQRVAGLLGLSGLLDRRPSQLSGGQQQRVALGRAFIAETPVCLMDEPLSNLDAQLRQEMRQEIRNLQRTLGITMVYVTHDQVEAMTLGDRVVVMKDGRVQQVGDPLQLYNQPANLFVAGFIGSPAMNFATVHITAENGALWALSDGIRLKVPAALAERLGSASGKDVTFGIRPEDLRLATDADPVDMSIEAVVEVIERLGSEILLDVAVGEGMMVAAVDPTVTAKVHERVRLAVNPHRLHFFDLGSEAAI